MARKTLAELELLADPDARRHAMQIATLAVDEDFAHRWVTTMRSIVDRDLNDAEFTAARMTALKLWKRDRSRAQSAIRWKFSDQRRGRLVDRDTTAVLADARAKVAAYRERQAEREER